MPEVQPHDLEIHRIYKVNGLIKEDTSLGSRIFAILEIGLKVILTEMASNILYHNEDLFIELNSNAHRKN